MHQIINMQLQTNEQIHRCKTTAIEWTQIHSATVPNESFGPSSYLELGLDRWMEKTAPVSPHMYPLAQQLGQYKYTIWQSEDKIPSCKIKYSCIN